jgi:hypothetical protein
LKIEEKRQRREDEDTETTGEEANAETHRKKADRAFFRG